MSFHAHRISLVVADHEILPRQIVERAAERSGLVSVRQWLRHDTRGFWEKKAGELLTRDDLKARIAEHGATAEQVIDEAATVLLLLATEAELQHARKVQRRGVVGRS